MRPLLGLSTAWGQIFPDSARYCINKLEYCAFTQLEREWPSQKRNEALWLEGCAAFALQINHCFVVRNNLAAMSSLLFEVSTKPASSG